MKLGNKGFVVSTLMYSLLIVFLFLILGLITLLSNRKMILDKLKKDVKNDINGMTKYDYYENGTAIYYNPVTGNVCSDYTENNSLNENKTGCLKWYTFNDNVNKNRVNMILDHNTTYRVAYNSEGTNAEAKEADTELRNLVNVSNWQVTPRMITADEVAKITGIDSSTSSNSIYFDGEKYSWLFDYTTGCQSYGCDKNDSKTEGYWTSNSIIKNTTNEVRIIWCHGNIDHRLVDKTNDGIRPVITVSKKNLQS